MLPLKLKKSIMVPEPGCLPDAAIIPGPIKEQVTPLGKTKKNH
jgi:hypothetical protein